MFLQFKIPYLYGLLLLPLAGNLSAAEEVAAPPTPSRWVLGKGLTTEWLVNKDTRLPHKDFIEQGGLRVGQIVHYQIDG